MKTFQKLGLLASLGGLGLLLGCGGGYYYAGVNYGPPAPLVDAPYGIAPGPDYIWTPGYYDYFGGSWAWRHGEWRRRPHPEDQWIAPRWEHRGNHYAYHEGGWQHGGQFHH